MITMALMAVIFIMAVMAITFVMAISRVQYSRVAGTLSQSSCYYYKPHTTLSTTLYRTNTTPRVFWETDSTLYSSSFPPHAAADITMANTSQK